MSASWRCDGYACPVRAPALALEAPRCYTCGKPMARVAGPLAIPLMTHDEVLFPSGTPATTMQAWIDARREWGREVREAVAKPIRDASWGTSVLNRIPRQLLEHEAVAMRDTWLEAWPDLKNYLPKPRRYPAVDVQRALHALPNVERVAIEANGPRLKIRCVVDVIERETHAELQAVIDQVLPPGTEYLLTTIGPDPDPAKLTLLLK